MKDGTPRFNPVQTIVASAGTGKTHSLVERIVAAVEGGIEPERLLATTFTKRATAELIGRIRRRLIERGQPHLAAEMLSARIGTVNSVCGALIADFAFELGRSPVADVISEDRQKVIFERAIGPAITAFAPRIERIAQRFGIEAQGRESPAGRIAGWQDDIRRIVDLARSNGIGADALGQSAQQSIEGLIALLGEPRPGDTAEDPDEALRRAVVSCSEAVTAQRANLKKGTLKNDAPAIASAHAKLAAGGQLAWSEWARLSKLGATQSDKPLFDEVISAAASHHRHPRLRSELEAFIRLQFECAAQCMDDYARYKRERGLLDFVDQELLALEILSDARNHLRLREMIGAVFVDEYQDSSPIQIAIFYEVAKIAPLNVWVGDPKQSIYGFRDADPELTLAASRAITFETTKEFLFLQESYRCRPALGALVNSSFEANFRRVGLTEQEIIINAYDRREASDGVSPLSVWRLLGRNAPARCEHLAGMVAGLLQDRRNWKVYDEERPARGGDIAILCRSNKQVLAVAGALSACGVKVAVERRGLMARPEVELAGAAFRWVADDADRLALAELARLASNDTAWLAAAFEPNGAGALEACAPFVAELRALREAAINLTPAEVFESILQVEGLVTTIAGWGAVEERLANLEAVRGMLRAFQDEQRAERRPATLTSAVEWLCEQDAAEVPASRDPNAVNVLTYHGAKGLQWPIVVMTELESKPKGDVFNLVAEQGEAADWRTPLAGRRLRYWPWPYESQSSGITLADAAAECPVGVEALAAEKRERVRLLYVGMTRARDHLALSVGGDPAWLNELVDEEGRPLVALQGSEIVADGDAFPTRAAPQPSALDASVEAAAWLAPTVAAVAHPPLILRPSDAAFDREPDIIETVTLGPRIPLAGNPDMAAVGEAVHRFLASDESALPSERREQKARDVLRRWGVPQLSPTDLVIIADRLDTFLSERKPRAARRPEWPVHAVVGKQIISGRIDLLLDDGHGYDIFDHKSFPGAVELGSDRLREIAGQLSHYATALKFVCGPRPTRLWLHQPISGNMTALRI